MIITRQSITTKQLHRLEAWLQSLGIEIAERPLVVERIPMAGMSVVDPQPFSRSEHVYPRVDLQRDRDKLELLASLVDTEIARRQQLDTWRVAAIDALYEARPERDRAALAILTTELADEVGEAPDPGPPPRPILVGDHVRVIGPAVWAGVLSFAGRTGTVIDPRVTVGIGPIPDDVRLVRLDGSAQPGERLVVRFHIRYLVHDEAQGGGGQP